MNPLTSHSARPRDVLRRHVPITSVVPRVQCNSCSILVPMNLAMDQYGYMVFRYVLFCGEAVSCRPSKGREVLVWTYRRGGGPVDPILKLSFPVPSTASVIDASQRQASRILPHPDDTEIHSRCRSVPPSHREICFRSNRNDGSCCTVPMTPGRKVLTSDTLRRLTQSGEKGARRETRACHG